MTAAVDYVILGAGAIGSILGAHLARGGHTVAMIARGRRADQVERDGLRITGLETFDVPVRVVRDPAALSGARALVVATKTPGTAEALHALRHARFDAALSIQNGPIKNDLLVEAFGRECVLGALANTSGELLPDGAVLFTRNVNVHVGELAGGGSARCERIVGELERSGVRATVSADVVGLEWSKFCGWTGLMAVSVTTRWPTWCYLLDPDSALVIARITREMTHIANRLGISITDESVLPAATLAHATEAAAVEAIRAIGERYRTGAPEHRMSSLQDMDAGRPLEVHETLGYAVAKAAETGVEAPVLDAFYHLVAAMDPARRHSGG